MSRKTSVHRNGRDAARKMAHRQGMVSDGQTYLCCAECGEYVNSSEAGAHRCPEVAKASETELGGALKIVLDLAKAAIPEPSVRLPAGKEEISRAMDVVEDLICDQGAPVCPAHEERLSALFEAMERHGDVEGTETQLGDAEEFLRLAFETMTDLQRTRFLESEQVKKFIKREQGEDAKEHSSGGGRNPCN